MIKKHRRNTRERRNGEREREKEVVGRSVHACQVLALSGSKLVQRVSLLVRFRIRSDRFGSVRYCHRVLL